MAHSPAVTIHRRIGVSAGVFTTALVPAAVERPGPQAGRHTLPPPRCPARRMAWWLPGRRCVRRSVPEPGRPAAYSSARLALTYGRRKPCNSYQRPVEQFPTDAADEPSGDRVRPRARWSTAWRRWSSRTPRRTRCGATAVDGCRRRGPGRIGTALSRAGISARWDF
jgi:hypothetical protein